MVVLAPGDVRSQVVCEVDHVILQGSPPIHGTANLSETIRVPPTVEVTQYYKSGKPVNIIVCQVKKFYPQRLQLTWLENGNLSRKETDLTLTENEDGTFNRMSWLLVNLSAHREDVVLTCQVEHDGQPAVTKHLTLETSGHQKDQSTDEPSGPGSLASLPSSSTSQSPLMLVPGVISRGQSCTEQESRRGSKISTEFLTAFLLGHKVLLAAGVSAIYVHRKLRA